MNKTGRDSMMRKISQFNPASVPMKAAEQVKTTLQTLSREGVREASAGAATFYIWVSLHHYIEREEYPMIY